jgi:hypothetical protein
MKNSLDVSKHQMNKEISNFAQRVIESEYSRDMIRNEIDTRFNNISKVDREIIINRIVRRSYEYAWSGENRLGRLKAFRKESAAVSAFDHTVDERKIRKTFAFRLFSFVIDSINGNTFKVGRDESLGKKFYSLCASTVPGELKKEAGDMEILDIFFKQAAAIIKKSGLFSKSRGVARVMNGAAPVKNLFLELFFSFWDRVNWDEIFPSNPDAARELMKQKHILIDMILKRAGAFRLDDVANEFFEFTGFGMKNSLYMISFLDFYFFTWLSNFGFIRYLHGRDDDPVCAELTEMGRSFLIALQGK